LKLLPLIVNYLYTDPLKFSSRVHQRLDDIHKTGAVCTSIGHGGIEDAYLPSQDLGEAGYPGLTTVRRVS
jgi:hypothetical protein